MPRRGHRRRQRVQGCDACPSAGDIVLPTEAESERIRADMRTDGLNLAGFSAPEFSLRDLDGRKITLESFQGRPLALIFWSPSCAPSLRALSELARLQPRFGDKGLAILAVVFTDDEERELRRVVAGENLGLPVLVSRDGKIRLAYQTNVVPTVVLNSGSRGAARCFPPSWCSARLRIRNRPRTMTALFRTRLSSGRCDISVITRIPPRD